METDVRDVSRIEEKPEICWALAAWVRRLS